MALGEIVKIIYVSLDFWHVIFKCEGFLGALVIKNLPANSGDVREVSSIPGSRRSLGGGHGNSLQHCLENRMDGGAWWAIVHGVGKIQT